MACQILIVLLTVIGTYVMVTDRNEGFLTVYGIRNLKFFTVDSNLFLGLVCALELGYAAGARSAPIWLERLLYIATVAVSLTFTVVVVFFGPALGYQKLFQGANLYFHLIIPVLAVLSFCTIRHSRSIPLWETAAALVPSVLYGAFYTAVLLVRGIHFPDTDWYGFASGGVIGSILTAGGIFLTTWILALLLRWLSGGTKRKETTN